MNNGLRLGGLPARPRFDFLILEILVCPER